MKSLNAESPIVWLSPKSLKASPNNPNKHSPEQIDRLIKIIQYQGWRHPIIIRKETGLVVAGHGRLQAALKMKLDKVPVQAQSFESDDQAYAFMVSDNAIASWADLDLSSVNLNLGDMDPSFDIEMLGLKDFEIEPADKYGDQDADEVPETRKTEIKLGDLYQLGFHRLLCGDSTDSNSVLHLMNGEKADITFTSPPYNANTKFTNVKNSGNLYANSDDNLESEEYVEFASSVLGNCIDNTSRYVFWNVNYNSNSRSEFIKQIIPFLDKLDETISWKKTALPVPYGLTRTWEPIFVFRCHDGGERITSAETAFNFWEISNNHVLIENHRATFPVDLPLTAIRLVSGSKSCLDPFAGSGTTLIACEKMGLKNFSLELDPIYVQCIIDRWEKLTGQKAIKLN